MVVMSEGEIGIQALAHLLKEISSNHQLVIG
jgi:hypothetical protein